MKTFFMLFGSDLWFLVLVFIVVSCLLTWLLVFKYPLDKAGFKKLDFLWLPLTIGSLLGIVEENRISIAKGQYQGEREWILSSEVSRIKNLLSLKENRLCQALQRGRNSSEDFDSTEADRQELCDWLIEIKKDFSDDLDSIQVIQGISMREISISDEFYLNEVREVRELLGEHNRNAIRLQQLKSNAKKSEIIDLLLFISPFFLTIAFSIRVVKTLGEIKLEKGKLW